MLVTLTFAALHINTNLYLCEFADAPTRGRELVFVVVDDGDGDVGRPHAGARISVMRQRLRRRHKPDAPTRGRELV